PRGLVHRGTCGSACQVTCTLVHQSTRTPVHPHTGVNTKFKTTIRPTYRRLGQGGLAPLVVRLVLYSCTNRTCWGRVVPSTPSPQVLRRKLMFRVLMHLAAILAGLLLGLFVLNFLADHLSELIGSQLLAD